MELPHYENKGAGGTNGSIGYCGGLRQWFQADGVIFENSLNQYISKKNLRNIYY
jgi:hypothetical protein